MNTNHFVDDKLYLSRLNNLNENCYIYFTVYDVKTNTWERLNYDGKPKSMMHPIRCYCCIFDGKIYIFKTIDLTTTSNDCYNYMDVYCPIANNWIIIDRKINIMSNWCHPMISISVGSSIFILNYNPYHLYQYKPDTESWNEFDIFIKKTRFLYTGFYGIYE